MKRIIICLVAVFFIVHGTIPSALWAKEQRRPIRIAYLQGDIHHLALWISLEKGFFKDEGLEVRVAGIFKAGPEEMSAFAAGALDIGYVGEAPATTAVANGAARVTVLAQVNTEGSAVVVGAGSSLRGGHDLQGKRVAIPGHATVQDLLLRKALVKYGLASDQVKIIVLKPPEMIGTLKTQQIDAFIAWEPYPSKAQTMDLGRVLLASGDIWPGHPCCVLVADNKFLAGRPEDAEAMVRVHVKATDFIHKHLEEAAAIGVKYTGMDQKTVVSAMKRVPYTAKLNIEGEQEYVDFLSKLKYIKVDDAQAFTDRFIDSKILGKIINR